MTSHAHAPALAVALLAGGVARPVSAQTVDFEDAEGDALYRAPAFQDLLLGQVTKDADGALQLLMEVAGAVPESPDLPRPGTEIWWTWVFEFDETAEPNGYPWIRAHRPEFMVYVRWDDSDFAGFAIDRRPLLTGGDAVVTALSSFGFTSDRTIIEIELESDLVGDFPDSFGWQLVAFDWSHVGSESCHVIDNFDFNYIPFP